MTHFSLLHISVLAAFNNKKVSITVIMGLVLLGIRSKPNCVVLSTPNTIRMNKLYCRDYVFLFFLCAVNVVSSVKCKVWQTVFAEIVSFCVFN